MKCRYLKANRTTQSHIGMSQNDRTHAKTTVMSVLLMLTEDSCQDHCTAADRGLGSNIQNSM